MQISHISNELIHWTGRGKEDNKAFEIMREIITENKLLLSNCPTTANHGDVTAEEQIVCFTDIPLELSEIHCSQFGRFGVAFNKNKFIEYGANPVLYYTTEMQNLIENVYHTRIQITGAKSIDLELHKLLSKLSTLFQSYGYKSDNDDLLNYHQREWRLAFDSDKMVNRFHETPSAGSYILGTPKNTSYFVFSKQDIDFIVIPKNFKNEAEVFLNCLEIAIPIKIFEEVVSENA